MEKGTGWKGLLASGLRVRLLALVLLSLLPIVVLTVYNRFDDRRIALEHETSEALRIARLAAEHQSRLFEGARQLLVGLAQLQQVQSLDARRSTALFQHLIARFPFYTNIAATTPAGDIFAAAVMAPVTVNIADREYFQRALRTRDFVYSGYVIGRTTGKPTITLAYPALDASGGIRALVFAALDVSRLGHVGAAVRLPPGSVIMQIDGSGVYVARHPDAPWVGKAMPAAGIVRAILARRSEGTARTRGVDGVARLYAFAPLPAAPGAGELYTAVGLPEATALAEANRRLGWALGALVGTLGLIFLVAWVAGDRLVLRPIWALTGAAASLAAGDLAARTGLGHQRNELGELARTFDGMAATLEARDRDLREEQGKSRALVEQSLAGVYLIRGEQILYVNDAFARMLGYSVEEIVGRLRAMDLVDPGDRARVIDNIRARLEGEMEALRYGLRCVRKDGVVLDCEVFGRRIAYEGEPAILGTMIDITERKRAEAELRRLNRSLHAISRCNMALVRARDEAGLLAEVCRLIVEVAGHASAWVGLAEEAGAGTIRPVAQAGAGAEPPGSTPVSVGDAQQEGSPAAEAIRTGRPVLVSRLGTEPTFATWRAEARRRGHGALAALPLTVDGRALGVLVIAATEPTAFDEAETELLVQLAADLGYGIASLRDRAARLRLEEEREQERRAMYQREKLAEMGSLLAGVAHELNNPLAVVIGRISLLRSKLEAGALAEGLDKVAAAAARCVRIVRNFLALARQRPPERTQVSLNQSVTEAVELLAYPLRVDSVQLEMRLAEDLPGLWGDPHQLQQVVVNLITNAHQAMRGSPGQRRLALSTRHDPERGRVTLEVADTGPGIPSEVQARIFEPFFTTKPVGQGTGLGLAMCQGIVEGHGGSITAGSAPGQGATFVVELPVGERPAGDAEAPAAPGRPASRGKTILAVDDEPEVLGLLQEILAEDHHHVDTAVNGTDALARLRERAYDAVVSDIRMPDLDGPGLFSAIQRHHPELAGRVVFMTGDSLSPQTRQFLDTSGAPSLEKPFRPEDLRRALGSVLPAPGAARSLRILVVEDEKTWAAAVGSLLRRHGFDVLIAPDGERAMRDIAEAKPDLVLLDLLLPGLTGFEVLDRLRADPVTAGIPVIAVSALAGERDVHTALERGAVSYFVKGEMSFADLLRRVSEVLEGRRPARGPGPIATAG